MATGSSSGNGTGRAVKQGPQWVPLKEASAEAGVSVSTLRNWYRKGQIEARTRKGANGEQRMVRLDEVLQRKDSTKPSSPRRDPSDWIDLRQASAEAGVSVSTLRNWYRKGAVRSRLQPGPNGRQRMVPRDEVLRRAAAGKRSAGRAGGTGTSRLKADGGSELVPVARALPDLIKDLAAARERAGRAETKSEFLSQQLAEAKARVESLEREARDRSARAPVEAMPREIEELREEPEVAPLETASSVRSGDGLPEDFPREEDDEYLALMQRWMARRRRRKILRLMQKTN